MKIDQAHANLLNLILSRDLARVKRELSQPGSMVSLTVGSKKRTTLMVAASTGYVPMAKLLLSYGQLCIPEYSDGVDVILVHMTNHPLFSIIKHLASSHEED